MKLYNLLIIGLLALTISCSKEEITAKAPVANEEEVSGGSAEYSSGSGSGGSGGGTTTTGLIQNVLSVLASRLVCGSTDSI